MSRALKRLKPFDEPIPIDAINVALLDRITFEPAS
jgi:hypothetical protein